MEALGPKAILAGRCSKSSVAVLVEQGHTHTHAPTWKHRDTHSHMKKDKTINGGEDIVIQLFDIFWPFNKSNFS